MRAGKGLERACGPLCMGVGPWQLRRDRGLASQLLSSGPVALCALERNGACWGLPLLCSAELALVIAPQKTGIDAGLGLASSLVLVPIRGTWRTFCASGGLPGSSLFLLWGGWLPRPLRTCSLGLAGCPGLGPGPLLLFPLGSSLLEQKAKEPQHTAAGAPPYTRCRVLEAREQLKAAASPSDTRKSTDMPGPSWPSEPGPGFSTRTRS